MRGGLTTIGATLLLLALASCGSSGSGEPTVPPPGPPPASEEGATNQPIVPSALPSSGKATPGTRGPSDLAPATQAPPPAPGHRSPCKTGQLSIRLLRQLGMSKDRAGGLGLITLTNTGAKTCALSGWPTVVPSRGGALLSVASTKVNAPRSPVGMALQPQRTAFAGLRWRACPPTATGCRTVDGFRVGVAGSAPAPATLAGFTAAELKGFAVSSLLIGSLQPTTTDIINW